MQTREEGTAAKFQEKEPNIKCPKTVASSEGKREPKVKLPRVISLRNLFTSHNPPVPQLSSQFALQSAPSDTFCLGFPVHSK